MPYNANIPQATDQMSQSQADILANFQFLNTIASGIYDAAPQLAAPVFPIGDNGLYTLNYATTGVNELWLTNAAGVSTPITAGQKTVNGWTFLPCGLLVAWGQFSATGAAVFVYAGITNFPGFSATPIAFQLTCIRTTVNPAAQVYLDSFSAGANTALQLGVYVTNFAGAPATSTIRFLVMGNP